MIKWAAMRGSQTTDEYGVRDITLRRPQASKTPNAPTAPRLTRLPPKSFRELDGDDPSCKPMVSSAFVAALVQARAARHLTREQLARQCDVQAKVIADIETRKVSKPPPALVQRLNRVLGVTLPRD